MKYVITLNEKKYEVEVEESAAAITSVCDAPAAAPAAAPAPVAAAPAAATAPVAAAPAAAAVSGTQVCSPMPGTILALKAAPGEAVKAGQVLVVLEAMKMENDIVAPADGTVAQVLAAKGASVNTDDVLVVLR